MGLRGRSRLGHFIRAQKAGQITIVKPSEGEVNGL